MNRTVTMLFKPVRSTGVQQRCYNDIVWSLFIQHSCSCMLTTLFRACWTNSPVNRNGQRCYNRYDNSAVLPDQPRAVQAVNISKQPWIGCAIPPSVDEFPFLRIVCSSWFSVSISLFFTYCDKIVNENVFTNWNVYINGKHPRIHHCNLLYLNALLKGTN